MGTTGMQMKEEGAGGVEVVHEKSYTEISRRLSNNARIVCYIAIGIIWAIDFFVAMYAPQDVLDRDGVAAWYFNVVSKIFPALDANRANPVVRQVASLYYSIAWLAFPFFFYLIWNYTKSRKKGIFVKRRRDFNLSDWVAIGIGVPVALALAVVATFAWHGGDVRHVAFGSSRTVLAYFGLIRPWAIAAFLVLGLAPLKKIIFGRI